MSIIAIDFEASCLPRHGLSYPIEVGIADARGRRAWLIRPHPDWNGWEWTQEAENLHGITRDDLMREGQPAEVVANALAAALAGRRVIADSHIDHYWLETLCNAAGMAPPASVEHIEKILDEFKSTSEEIARAQVELDSQAFMRHRAGDDARWLFALIGILADASAARKYPTVKTPFSWPAGGNAPTTYRQRSAA